MSAKKDDVTGPDLAEGIALSELADGALVEGHFGDAAVVVARCGEALFAVGAHCTHYGAPLALGILVGDTIRCPWHHACFNLADGAALRAPALDPVECWRIERRGDKAVVTGKEPPRAAPKAPAKTSRAGVRIVIVGAGAAGNAAAEMLRREGFDGSITLLGAEPTVPSDRPNLSKDFLAGTATEAMIPLRPPEFYVKRSIARISGARVTAIDIEHKQVVLEEGATHPFDKLLLTTGAEAIRLQIPGSELPHVQTLHSEADTRSIIALATAKPRERAVVFGASFIGLEVAASLRARGIEVHVVAPGAVPLEHVLGRPAGEFIRRLHEEHGVVFHLGLTATEITATKVTLSNGTVLAADLVVMGVGVHPAVALAERAGLAMDRGVIVDEFLETSVPGIFAAGDIARYPDRYSGEKLRIEHWVSAERQGQTAARNLLGQREPYCAVPFFWSAHYDMTLSYVGHAERWDRMEMSGSLANRDCRMEYFFGPRLLGVATIGRDRESLQAEVNMERNDS